jgi:hypothetical protein
VVRKIRGIEGRGGPIAKIVLDTQAIVKKIGDRDACDERDALGRPGTAVDAVNFRIYLEYRRADCAYICDVCATAGS